MTENTLTDEQDSGGDATLLAHEQEGASGEQQPEASPAAGSGDESNQPDDANEAVIEKRLRDTQAKVTELAEQLKAAQTQLTDQAQKQEPFDEEKFIDDFVGGEDAYNKYRDDPALLAKDLARKLLYHNAQVLVDRDKYWQGQLDTVVNGMKTGAPEYTQYAAEIKEIEDNFDLSAMKPDDKVKLAKMMRGKRGGNGAAPPPGPRASKAAAPARKTAAPPGYFELLGLAGEPRNENTLL